MCSKNDVSMNIRVSHTFANKNCLLLLFLILQLLMVIKSINTNLFQLICIDKNKFDVNIIILQISVVINNNELHLCN